MKVLLCSIAASILGFVGHWALEGRRRLEDYAGRDPDFYKVGGTSVDDD